MMQHAKKYLLLAGLVFSYGLIAVAAAQNFITNPGFEGPDGIGIIPEDWLAGCGVMNTPDTQPGWWNIENKPQEGESYISLLYKEDGTTESVYQPLQKPLPAGSCFMLEIYLAQACQDSLSGLYPYNLNHPGDLVVRGSETYGCGNGQILATFEQVSNCRWRKFQAVFQAENEINYIYLEFFKGTSPFANGSILIDDLSLDFLQPLPEQTLSFHYLEEITLSASLDGSHYNWQIGDMFLEDDSSTQNLTVTENTTIELTYWSEDSCLITEHFVIYVDPLIPNVITPTGHDAINDIFYIDGLVETSNLQVINRWGQVVYAANGYQNNWSAQNLAPGVYFYLLHLTETDRYFQGSVTVL